MTERDGVPEPGNTRALCLLLWAGIKATLWFVSCFLKFFPKGVGLSDAFRWLSSGFFFSSLLSSPMAFESESGWKPQWIGGGQCHLPPPRSPKGVHLVF